ncbi:MAG: hypothetical protein AAGK98_18740 [Pseudomonadota bacterium]
MSKTTEIGKLDVTPEDIDAASRQICGEPFQELMARVRGDDTGRQWTPTIEPSWGHATAKYVLRQAIQTEGGDVYPVDAKLLADGIVPKPEDLHRNIEGWRACYVENQRQRDRIHKDFERRIAAEHQPSRGFGR